MQAMPPGDVDAVLDVALAEDLAALRPVAFRVGPQPERGGAPAFELVLADGRSVLVELDVAHAHAVRNRLTEILDGRICARPPSRRVLEIALGDDPDEAHADTARPLPVVPDLETDRQRQAAE